MHIKKTFYKLFVYPWNWSISFWYIKLKQKLFAKINIHTFSDGHLVLACALLVFIHIYTFIPVPFRIHIISYPGCGSGRFFRTTHKSLRRTERFANDPTSNQSPVATNCLNLCRSHLAGVCVCVCTCVCECASRRHTHTYKCINANFNASTNTGTLPCAHSGAHHIKS